MRIGVIGCGTLAQAVHIPLLARQRGVQLTALADNHASVLESARRLAPAAHAFSDGRELIGSGSVDAVVIATPASSHAWFAIAAFERGLHVYLEKPISHDLDDAFAIVDAWKQSGRAGMIGFNYRFNPLYQALRNVVRSEAIVSTESVFKIPRTAEMGWRAERSAGGGALLDLGSHHVDLIRFITQDEIAEVTARIRSIRSEQDSAALECVTQSGIACMIKAEYAGSFQHTFRITTSNSTHEIDLAGSHAVESDGRLNRFPSPARLLHIYRKLRSPAHEPSYAPALHSFVAAVHGTNAASPDMRDGLRALQITSAAEKSASSGSPAAVLLA
jgi:predicted dehydrogenase